MDSLAQDRITTFLKRVGDRYPRPSTLLLLGGSALALLGSPRPTADIDYVVGDREQDDLQRTISEVADELHIEFEPLQEMVRAALDCAYEYNLDGVGMRARLQVVRERL